MKSNIKLALVSLAAASMLFAGCAKKEVVETSGSESSAAVSAVSEPATPAKPAEMSVYFAFDSSELDASAQATLDAIAEWLKATGTNVTVEGNCDERGSREYNLALGQRRADSVRDYLIAHGVPAGQIGTVSYGEERPVCTSHGEACWAQNRRADIK
ncbi:MAG: peptidoglycan-associated lipoprotein Pal [Zetaproteobacteria bacterium]|nr:MAG: peptidoglycan-associated lipoprotein Pal [Zetaproteobacteria bacterium]